MNRLQPKHYHPSSWTAKV